jgi:hypothetical protein
MTEGVFANWLTRSYPFKFNGAIRVKTLVGGVPSDPNVAKGWIESKLKETSTDQRIQELIAQTVVERNVTQAEAVRIINDLKNLNGFKKGTAEDVGHEGELYVEGRQLKAALKEAVSVAVAAGKLDKTKWGATSKWLTNYFPEHVFVREERLYLGVQEPTGVFQQFVHTFRGSSIQYQEYVENAEFDFTVVTDHDFSDEDWAMIMTTGQYQGIGASRSQGYGTYVVTKWEKEVDEKALAALKKRNEKKPVKKVESKEVAE